MCLIKDQARHIYKKVESEGIVNVDTIRQEIEEDKLSKDNIDDEENPYHNIIINNIDRDNASTSQMEQWSILSNVFNYVQYDRNPTNLYELNIKALDQKNHNKMFDNLKDDERQTLVIAFGDNPDKLRRKYLHMYKGVQSEALNTIQFDANSDLSMTYLGRIDMTKATKIKAEEEFSISEQGYTVGKLLDGTECQILLDTGASKSFMSKSHYLRCKSLHSLPKFAYKTQRIQVEFG